MEITPPEIVTGRNLANYKANILIANTSKSHKSTRPPLFVWDIAPVDEYLNDDNIGRYARVIAVEKLLQYCKIKFGPRVIAEQQHVHINDPNQSNADANL